MLFSFLIRKRHEGFVADCLTVYHLIIKYGSKVGSLEQTHKIANQTYTYFFDFSTISLGVAEVLTKEEQKRGKEKVFYDTLIKNTQFHNSNLSFSIEFSLS